MHRQATGMHRLQLRVYAKTHENAAAYPMDLGTFELIGQQTKNPKNRLLSEVYQTYNAWRNGGFRGSRAEAHWWGDQLKKHRPDVVLCQYGPTGLRLFPLLQANHVKLMIHFHAFDITSALKGALYRKRLCAMLPKVSGCVVVAEYQRQILLDLGVEDNLIRVIPCGVPVAGIELNNKLGDQPCKFLAVGRFTSKKRPDLTLRAFAKCLAVVPDARLTMIGDGELYDQSRQLAGSLGVADLVEFLGAQPQERVRQELTSASVFVQHSMTPENGDMEGWPVSIAEAAGAGLPVVATRHASIPEQIEHGETGLLCAEGDWQTMGDCMAQLAADPNLRASMGRAGHEKIAEFDTAKQIDRLQDFILDTVKGSICS